MLLHGEALQELRALPDCSIDSVVTDPPYGLTANKKGGSGVASVNMESPYGRARIGTGNGPGGFMGMKWDSDVPPVEIWAECLRVLKPGGHLLAFAGTRTQHRMAVRIEDAGFEIRDMIAWVYGSGFPKSLDVSKAIDARGSATVAWFGSWFRKWRKDNGITQKQVAKLFPSKTGGLTGCVANWELGFNMPTPEQFNLIRDTFGLPFQSIQAAEREVLGRDTKARSTAGKSALPSMGGETVYYSWDITAPATDAARQWDGWGTALKPALEPITVARKPLNGTVAENVLAHGTGALNIDGCRVGSEGGTAKANIRKGEPNGDRAGTSVGEDISFRCDIAKLDAGRWPANLIHDGSEEVLELFPVTKSGGAPLRRQGMGYNGGAQAARFFYCAKASKSERGPGNTHPTVKPLALMRYLVRLVTPPGGTVLDPFMGSGTTGLAAAAEGFRFVGIERDEAYFEIARRRLTRENARGRVVI